MAESLLQGSLLGPNDLVDKMGLPDLVWLDLEDVLPDWDALVERQPVLVGQQTHSLGLGLRCTSTSGRDKSLALRASSCTTSAVRIGRLRRGPLLSCGLLIRRVLSCSPAGLRLLRKALRLLIGEGVATSLRLQLTVGGCLIVVFQWHSPLAFSCCTMCYASFEATIWLASQGPAAALIVAILLRVNATSHHVAALVLVLLVAVAHALTTSALVVRRLILREVIVARPLIVATLGWRSAAVASLALSTAEVLLLGLALVTTMVVVSIVALCVTIVGVALSEHCLLVVLACLLQVCFSLSLWFGL